MLFPTAATTTCGCSASALFIATSAGGLPLLNEFGVNVNEEGVLVKRGSDRDARDSGQFGVAMHYNFEPLDTEFGAYFMNYHSRAPIFSAKGASAATYAAANALTSTPAGSLRPLIVAGNSSYFVEYPEDIRLVRFEFLDDLAYRHSVERQRSATGRTRRLQLNTTDILYAGVTPLIGLGAASPLKGAPVSDLNGYRRKEITQLQTTFTHFFDQVMGASRLTLVGEVGLTHVGGLESSSKARYGRDPVFGPGEGPLCATLNAGTIAGAGAGARPQ